MLVKRAYNPYHSNLHEHTHTHTHTPLSATHYHVLMTCIHRVQERDLTGHLREVGFIWNRKPVSCATRLVNSSSLEKRDREIRVTSAAPLASIAETLDTHKRTIIREEETIFCRAAHALTHVAWPTRGAITMSSFFLRGKGSYRDKRRRSKTGKKVGLLLCQECWISAQKG